VGEAHRRWCERDGGSGYRIWPATAKKRELCRDCRRVRESRVAAGWQATGVADVFSGVGPARFRSRAMRWTMSLEATDSTLRVTSEPRRWELGTELGSDGVARSWSACSNELRWSIDGDGDDATQSRRVAAKRREAFYGSSSRAPRRSTQWSFVPESRVSFARDLRGGSESQISARTILCRLHCPSRFGCQSRTEG